MKGWRSKAIPTTGEPIQRVLPSATHPGKITMRTLLLVWLGLGLASFMASGPARAQAAKSKPNDEPIAQGKPLRFWIDQLKEDDVLTREEAIEALADLGAAANEAV